MVPVAGVEPARCCHQGILRNFGNLIKRHDVFQSAVLYPRNFGLFRVSDHETRKNRHLRKNEKTIILVETR